jgi:hypothetical protein
VFGARGFRGEQFLFPIGSPAATTLAAARRHDAMTGNVETYRVGGAGARHRPQRPSNVYGQRRNVTGERDYRGVLAVLIMPSLWLKM